MFVYCGDAENGKLRVLDTSDMVIEEIDELELKAVQAKGYKVVKNFDYDYSMTFLYNISLLCNFGAVRDMSWGLQLSKLGQDVLNEIDSIKDSYGVGFRKSEIGSFIDHEIYFAPRNYKLVCAFLFEADFADYTLKVCIASHSGIFVNDFNIKTLPNNDNSLKIQISCMNGIVSISIDTDNKQNAFHMVVDDRCRQL